MPMKTRAADRMKATRQPHERNCASVRLYDRMATTPEARHRPMARPICGRLA